MTIDIGKIRNAAISASIFWPQGIKIKTGRWTAIDRMINKLQPKIVLAMCDEIERLRKDAEKYRLRVEIAQAQIEQVITGEAK